MAGIKTIAFGTLGVGTLGGAITGGYFLFNSSPKNIKDLIIKEQHKTLNTEDDTDNETWKKLIKNHSTIKGADESKKIKGLKLSATASSAPNKNDINALKAKCRELFNKPITKGEEFNTNKDTAIYWCTKTSNFARG